MKLTAPSWYTIRNAAGPDAAEVLLYDEIGAFGVNAKSFADSLKAVTAKNINLRINSPGGSVFDGTAIYNTLKAHPARVVTHIDGLAASIASLIALAGDEVRIASNGFFMIHNARGAALGEKGDMRKLADVLDKIDQTLARTYAQKTGKSEAEMKAAMDAETWYTAQEAKAVGLVDVVAGELKAAACFDLGNFSRVPQALRARVTAAATPRTTADAEGTPTPAQEWDRGSVDKGRWINRDVYIRARAKQVAADEFDRTPALHHLGSRQHYIDARARELAGSN
jgi:ATP-dependent Clp endopeptidase proteolytic subunit ClpP